MATWPIVNDTTAANSITSFAASTETGKTTVTSASHGISNDYGIQIISGSYTGYWVVSNVTTNTFDIDTPFVGDETSTWQYFDRLDVAFSDTTNVLGGDTLLIIEDLTDDDSAFVDFDTRTGSQGPITIKGDTPTRIINNSATGPRGAMIRVSNGCQITINIEDLVLNKSGGGGVQLFLTESLNSSFVLNVTNCEIKSSIATNVWQINHPMTAGQFNFNKCTFDGVNSGGASDGTGDVVGIANTSPDHAANSITFKNCILKNSRHAAIADNSQQTTIVTRIFNCTFDNCGFNAGSNDKMALYMTSYCTTTNCLFTNNNDDVLLEINGRDTDFTYCAFEEESGTGFGSNNIFNIVSTDEYTDETTDDFSLKSGAQSIDNGTDLSGSGVTDDFIGTSRPQGSAYDIGAYEYIPPATGFAGEVMMLGCNF